MINKDTYKRLTKKDSCYYDEMDNIDIDEVYNRLVEIEDKIMDGTLIEIDESIIGQGIIGIHHFTDGTYQLDLDENIIIGFSSDGVITWNSEHCYNDEFRNGMFFMDNEKGKSEAEARLKELQEEQQ